MGLKFVDEPPKGGSGRKKTDYTGHLVELVNNRGKWALICHYKGKSSAYSMPKRFREFPGWGGGNVEFATRRNPNGGSDMYARYIGTSIPHFADPELVGNGSPDRYEELESDQV